MAARIKWGLAVIALILGLHGAVKAEETAMGSEGLYTQPWFSPTTTDLSRDLAAAGAAGKILAVVWEQKGCFYCRQLHEVNFKDRVLVDYFTRHFHVVQLNWRGTRPMNDFDGGAMEEQDLGRNHRIGGTPTISFYRPGDPTEVFRMPGYAKPDLFLGVLNYVETKGYETASLKEWFRAKADGQGE